MTLRNLSLLTLFSVVSLSYASNINMRSNVSNYPTRVTFGRMAAVAGIIVSPIAALQADKYIQRSGLSQSIKTASTVTSSLYALAIASLATLGSVFIIHDAMTD